MLLDVLIEKTVTFGRYFTFYVGFRTANSAGNSTTTAATTTVTATAAIANPTTTITAQCKTSRNTTGVGKCATTWDGTTWPYHGYG